MIGELWDATAHAVAQISLESTDPIYAFPAVLLRALRVIG
jgi:hypothetical protein